MKNYSSSALAAATTLVLAACGGGGSDGGTATIATAYDVTAAQRHLLTDSASWTMIGSRPAGGTYTIIAAQSPLPAAVPIGGTTAYPRSRQVLTLQQTGVAPVVAAQNVFFDSQSLAIIQTEADDNTCSIATSNSALPASAAIGASGPLYSLSDRASCAIGAAATGTTTATWSLENDAGVVLLCWNATGKDAAGAVLGSTASCVQVAADGTLGTKARLTLSADGLTTTARNY